RDRVVKRRFVAVAALMLTASAAQAYFSTNWYEDAAGYRQAQAQQKLFHAPMLVYFRADWCPHCKKFDQLLLDPEVRQKLGAVVKVRINPEHGVPEADLFNQDFESSDYPSVFLVREGSAPARISHSGPAEEFLAQLPAAAR